MKYLTLILLLLLSVCAHAQLVPVLHDAAGIRIGTLVTAGGNSNSIPPSTWS